ncbi:Rv3654c family TadE-like protein [Isoptericola jiangsuensis]|uniref:Rv3654c family TadE-like protein n=1 Tax=Isoptericola jiangsuensis TaxID=548579 RepID=UPI003AB0E5AA
MTGGERAAGEPATGGHAAGEGAGGGERGAGTVLLIGIVAVVLLCMAGLSALGSAQQARVTAQSAADLGALAGASALRHGLDACTTAGRTVARNGSGLAGCVVEEGGVVAVVASRPAGHVVDLAGVATARARAGPASARTNGPP